MNNSILAGQSVTLSVSCVTFALDRVVLLATLESLAIACNHAKSVGVLAGVHLYLIDNGPDIDNKNALLDIAQKIQIYFDELNVISGHGNVGYGRGNNLAILETSCDYHLVINPDVLVAEDNIEIALTYMQQELRVGLLAPDGWSEAGYRQYLAKREPSLLILLARAIQNKWLDKKIKSQLNSYEYRDLIPAPKPIEIELASGCYMMLRTSVLQKIGGFNPDFFMYFEDFELSRRIASLSQVVHHPKIRIVHYGGGAFSKGPRHIRFFFISFLKYKLLGRTRGCMNSNEKSRTNKCDSC